MAEETKSNLEPIEESDLGLKEKFIGGAKIEKKESAGGNVPELKTEEMHSIEGGAERKEGAAEKEAAYSKILSKVSSASQAVKKEDVAADAETANVGTDAESKIKNLVVLAQTKGIPHAVKVARHMEDNYTLDEFHDRLLGEELHSALVQKGMIKEI